MLLSLNYSFDLNVDLYQERMVVWEEQERKKKEDEKRELELETKRKIREKERREIDKEMIQRHRRNQNEIRGQNKFTLEKELRNKVLKSFIFFIIGFNIYIDNALARSSDTRFLQMF